MSGQNVTRAVWRSLSLLLICHLSHGVKAEEIVSNRVQSQAVGTFGDIVDVQDVNPTYDTVSIRPFDPDVGKIVDVHISLDAQSFFSGYSLFTSTSGAGLVSLSTTTLNYNLAKYGATTPINQDFMEYISCPMPCGAGTSSNVTFTENSSSSVLPSLGNYIGGNIPITIVNDHQSISGGALTLGTNTITGTVLVDRTVQLLPGYTPTVKEVAGDISNASTIVSTAYNQVSISKDILGGAKGQILPTALNAIEYQTSMEKGVAGSGVVAGIDTTNFLIQLGTGQAEFDPVGFAFAVDALLFDYISVAAAIVHLDPPDSNFATVSAYQPLTANLTGVSDPAAKSLLLGSLNLLNFSEEFALSATDYERYEGAVIAGDYDAAKAQYAAFLVEYAAFLRDAGGASLSVGTLEDYLKSMALTGLIPSDALLANQAYLRMYGFPKEVSDLLDGGTLGGFGVSSATALQAYLDADPTNGTYDDLLANLDQTRLDLAALGAVGVDMPEPSTAAIILPIALFAGMKRRHRSSSPAGPMRLVVNG